MTDASKNRAWRLLAKAFTDVAGSIFDERPHAFLRHVHVELQAKNANAYRKSLIRRRRGSGEAPPMRARIEL